MKRALLSELNLNDKFKLFENGCVWKVIEVSPAIYPNALRASSGRITSPFSKAISCFLCES